MNEQAISCLEQGLHADLGPYCHNDGPSRCRGLTHREKLYTILVSKALWLILGPTFDHFFICDWLIVKLAL